MNEEQKKHILAAINMSGFASELRVNKITTANGWDNINNFIYLDSEKKISREIDLVSMIGVNRIDSNYNMDFKITLVIEVKKSKKDWIFFVTQNNSNNINDSFLSTISYNNIDSEIYEDFHNINPRKNENFICTSYMEAVKKDATKHEGVSDIYKAMDSVVKATNYFYRTDKLTTQMNHQSQYQRLRALYNPIYLDDPSSIHIYIPLIVFEGIMYKAWLTNDSEIDFDECKFIPFETFLFDKDRENFFPVDIVTMNYLDTYLKDIKKWYEQIINDIENSRKKAETKDKKRNT